MTVYDQNQPTANNVFISYSSIDRLRTNGLGLLLEAMGHQVFHDHRTIKPGMRWEAALQEGLDEADVMMVFWTKHAARSDWVRKEYEHFYTKYPDRLLVPVLADETPLTDILKTRQHADFAPVVNEVLDMKRKMKKEGAGAGAIEAAVLKRLDEAEVEIKTSKQRRRLFLFLGFGWLLSLLRYPGSAVRKLGRGTVEKTAQLTAGQLAVIGVAATLGLAAGAPVAERLGRPDTIEAAQILPVAIWGDSLSDFRSGFVESRTEVDQRLAEIYSRLDDLILSWGDSLAQCRQEVRVLSGGGAAMPLGQAPPSDLAAVTSSAPDQPPGNLVATIGGLGQIVLTWEDRSGNEEGFEILRCLGPDCTDFARIAETGPNATAFSDAGLDSDELYRYRIRAFSAGGSSDYSNAAQSVVIHEGDVLPEMENRQRVFGIVENRMQGQTSGGSVVLAVLIDEEGRVSSDTDPTVVSSSGNVELIGAALAAVKEARFKPAEKAGQKVSVWVQVPVTFVVRD